MDIEETSISRWQLDCIFFLYFRSHFFDEWGGCWWCIEQKDIFEVWYLEDLGKYLSTQLDMTGYLWAHLTVDRK